MNTSFPCEIGWLHQCKRVRQGSQRKNIKYHQPTDCWWLRLPAPMLCFQVRSSCQCNDSPPNDRSHTCYQFEIWNPGHIMTYHSSCTWGSNPDETVTGLSEQHMCTSPSVFVQWPWCHESRQPDKKLSLCFLRDVLSASLSVNTTSWATKRRKHMPLPLVSPKGIP